MTWLKSVASVRVCKGLSALTLFGAGAGAGRGHLVTMVLGLAVAGVFYAFSYLLDSRST